MCWPPNGCTATTRRFPSSPKARRKPAGFGSMSATTGRSAARIRRRRCSTPRAIERANIPSGILASYAGILQADAFDGYNRLYLADRKPGPIVEALCWSHARRKFFELADIAANARRGKNAPPISPIALEAVKRIDALFDIEREINGLDRREALRARRKESAALVAALEDWMRAERAKLSRHAAVAKAIDYMLTRWEAFTRFLDDGRICLTNNAAERALRGLRSGQEIVAVRRIRARGRARRRHVHADPDRQAQRRRSAGLARRRPRPHRRHAADQIADLLPWNWRPNPLPRGRLRGPAAYAEGLP